MIEAVREGWQNYLADPTQTNEYMGKLNPTMDAKTFKDSAEAQKPLIETGDTKRLRLGAMTIERWQMLVQQLVDLKVIDNQVDAQASFSEPTKSK
jgi:NitT/TauT family transport system substrate-binding protein